ncbi:MAG: hypothetical protein GF317_11230 [Candidatus Lokiarchaeota archaeon]|nr:hypothetical protein [Candidatus Lokiarchaeota archaeon]MBD3200221.1 hypothetical protein [Candidatus Lokiarchaeota archaeon]
MIFKKKIRRNLLFFLTSLIITILLSNLSLVSAYYGDGDCSQYHGTTIIDIPVDNDAVISLDGEKTESFWTDHSNQNGIMSILLSEERMSTGETPKINTLNATFIMNQNSIYIFCEWFDSTPGPETPLKDEICFCWNINTPNFSAFYESTMDTVGMGGGKLDSWRWKYPNDDVTDMGCDEQGWESGEIEHVQGKYIYSESEDKYSLELRRDINTNDEYDVQFNQNKLFLFNIAIFNDSTHDQHAISWTYGLDLRSRPPSTIGFPPGLWIPVLIFFLLVNLIYLKKKYKL